MWCHTWFVLPRSRMNNCISMGTVSSKYINLFTPLMFCSSSIMFNEFLEKKENFTDMNTKENWPHDINNLNDIMVAIETTEFCKPIQNYNTVLVQLVHNLCQFPNSTPNDFIQLCHWNTGSLWITVNKLSELFDMQLVTGSIFLWKLSRADQ